MSAFFFDEFVLCGYIFGGLIISSFMKARQKTAVADHLYQKKLFFLFCRIASIALIVTFCSTLMTIWFSFYPPILEGGNHLTSLTVWLVDLTQLPGQSLTRNDLLVQVFTLLFNALVLFYFLLLEEFLRLTQQHYRYIPEVPVLIITIFLSLKIFLMASDLILLIITVELAAFCSIILLGLQTTTSGVNVFAIEAAIKYFVFNAVGVAFLLLGTNGYFAIYSSTNLQDVAAVNLLDPLPVYLTLETVLATHCLFFFGYLMKLGAAPLHQWVPDVYEGAELLITALLVLLVGPVLNFKFFILVKTLLPVFETNHFTFLFFLLVGFFSVLIGSFNAFSQIRIKRFLAYAGITHLGFILLSFGTASFIGLCAAFFYLLFYILSNLVFFSLLLLSRRLTGTSLLFLNQLKLITTQNPFLFFFLFVPLFSYAGFPPFAGFFTKLGALVSLIDLNHVTLLIALVILVVFSAYLYLRFIKIMVFERALFFLFLPIHRGSSYKSYYQVSNYYQQLKSETIYNSLLFFILFLANSAIVGFIYFCPILFLMVFKPLVSLILFY